MRPYEHMNDEQLEAYVGIAGQDVLSAVENDDAAALERAKQVYAEALNAYRNRSN